MSDNVFVSIDENDPEIIYVEVFESIGAPGPPGPGGGVDESYVDENADKRLHSKKYGPTLQNFEVGKVNAKKGTGQLKTLCAYDSLGYLGTMDEYHTNMKTRYGGLATNGTYPVGWSPIGGTFGWGQSPNRITVSDAVFNGTTRITSATAAFANSDVNRTIVGSGIPANAIITNRVSATAIDISVATTTSGTGKSITVGPSAIAGGCDGYMVQLLNGEFIKRGTMVGAPTTVRIFFDPSSTGTFQCTIAGVNCGPAIDTSSGTYTHGTVKYYDLAFTGAFFQDFQITSTSGTCLIWGTDWYPDVNQTTGNHHIQFQHPGMGIYDYNRFPGFQPFLQWYQPHALFTDMFINDDGRGAATFGTEIDTFVNACRSSSPKTDIIWMSAHGTVSHPNAADLHTKIVNRAYVKGFHLLDMYEVLGTYTEANGNALLSGDGVHLSTLGKDVWSDTMTGLLEGMESITGAAYKTDGSSVAQYLRWGTWGIPGSQVRAELRGFSGQTFVLFADGSGSTAWPQYIGDGTILNSANGITGQMAARLYDVFQNRTSYVRTVTTASITLSGLQTINGYTTLSGDLVLVNNPTTGSQNGIYTAVAGTWTRHQDFDSNWTVTMPKGKNVIVLSGNSAGTLWYLSNTAIVTVGTSTPTWVRLVPTDFNASKLTNVLNGTAATDVASVKQAKGAMWKSTYYSFPKFVTQATAAFTLGNLLVVPMFLATRQQIAALGCDMTVAAAAGGKARFVLYSDGGLGAFPSVNLWNGAQIATDVATGWIEDTAIGSGSIFAGPGWIFPGMVLQAFGATFRSITQLDEPLPMATPTGVSTPSGWLTTGVTSGTGPTPWTSTSQGASAPLMKVKFT